jgi:hypothetical protein
VRTSFLAASLLTALSGAALTSACSGDIGELPFDTGGNGGGGNGGSGAGGDPLQNPKFEPAPAGIRRLLGRQYRNSIRGILGDAAAAAATPPPDSTLNEFQTLANAELSVAPTDVDQYEASARAVSAAVLTDSGTLAKLTPCVPLAADDADCHRQVIDGVGHQLWRRKLTEDEIAPIIAIAQNAGAEYGNFNAGVQYALMTLLQSPYFIYTIEIGGPDPAHPAWFKLTGPELATRMSLFLLDTTPDAALLEEAESGGLATDGQVRTAARAMLENPGARDALASFYDVFFKLNELPSQAKDATIFPEFNAAMGESMRQETLRFFSDLVWDQDADYRTAFTADYAFVDANLASIYGVTAPAAGFEKMTLPAAQKRAGFIGQASYLTRYAHPSDTSPTRRGVFLSNKILCNEVQPPPAGVNTMLPAFDPNKPQTKKQYLEAIHQAPENCHSCHGLMDPFGYAAELYDGVGRYRTTDEHGLTIDPSGEVADFGAFDGPLEMGQLFYDDPRAMSCIVKNLFRQSMGHKETKGERPALSSINDAFEASGFKLQDAIVEIVASPAFAYVGDPK